MYSISNSGVNVFLSNDCDSTCVVNIVMGEAGDGWRHSVNSPNIVCLRKKIITSPSPPIAGGQLYQTRTWQLIYVGPEVFSATKHREHRYVRGKVHDLV